MSNLTNDEIFAAEFRGLFWGDGNIEIDKVRLKTSGNNFRIRFRIIARDDNAEMLHYILGRIGGGVSNHKAFTNSNGYISNPQIVWQTQSMKDATKVLKLLEGGLIPAKKQQELIFVRRALTIMTKKGYRYSAEEVEELGAIISDLRKSRSYN